MPRLNDTKAIAERDVGGVREGLYGTCRYYRKDRAVEEAMKEALMTGNSLPEQIHPRGTLVGEADLKGACKELDKK